MANFKKNAAITAMTLSLCLSTLPATALAAEQEATLSPIQTLEYHNGDNNNGEGNGHFDHGNGNGFGHDKDEKPNKNEKPDKGEDDDLDNDQDNGQGGDLGNDQDNSQDEDLGNDQDNSQDKDLGNDQDDAAPAPEDHGTVSTPNGVYQGHGMVEFHLTKSAIQAILDNQNAANQTWGQLEDATLIFKADITCFDHRDMTYNLLWGGLYWASFSNLQNVGPENLDGVALTFEDGSELFIPACDLGSPPGRTTSSPAGSPRTIWLSTSTAPLTTI